MRVDDIADYGEVLKFSGRAIRKTVERVVYAECQNEDCPKAWTSSEATIAGGRHVVSTGHTVLLYYSATHEIRPNPNKGDWLPQTNTLAKMRRAQAELERLKASAHDEPIQSS